MGVRIGEDMFGKRTEKPPMYRAETIKTVVGITGLQIKYTLMSCCVYQGIRLSGVQTIMIIFSLGGGIIVWDKCNDGSCQSDAEIAYNSLTNRVDICRYMWRGMMQGKSITEGWIQQGNKKLNEKRIHPTQKPVNLYRWIIQKYDIPKEWKLIDTHVGSASSLIAYHGAGMQHVIGFEIDEYMYHKSLDRYKQETAQLSLHDIGMI